VHFSKAPFSIEQVAEPEGDGDGIHAAIRQVEPADVADSELDFRFPFSSELDHNA
jgi:hypothetical protein